MGGGNLRSRSGDKEGEGRHPNTQLPGCRPHSHTHSLPGCPERGGGGLTPPTSLGLQSCTMRRAQPGTCLPSLLDPSGPGHMLNRALQRG